MKPSIKMEWAKIERDEKGQVAPCYKNFIYLDFTITAETEKEANRLRVKLEEVLTSKSSEFCEPKGFLWCSSYEELHEKKLLDSFAWKRELEDVRGQKEFLWKIAQEAKRSVLRRYKFEVC